MISSLLIHDYKVIQCLIFNSHINTFEGEGNPGNDFMKMKQEDDIQRRMLPFLPKLNVNPLKAEL